MQILLLDESKKRRTQIAELLQKKKHTIRQCAASNDFMSVIEDSAPDRIILDGDTWRKGRAIYAYFNFGKKLENIPIVFYNVKEGAVTITGRESNAKDRILAGITEANDIVSAFEQNL
jgi:DNA-binding response OmpR family regulator